MMDKCSKCGAIFPHEQARMTGFGINTRIRTYCPACWRKVEWARTHQRGTDPRRVQAWQREASRESAEERANNRYWERVDNYRELGYDPN